MYGSKESDDLTDKGFTALTKDHRPDDPTEKERIEKTGVARVEAFYVAKGREIYRDHDGFFLVPSSFLLGRFSSK